MSLDAPDERYGLAAMEISFVLIPLIYCIYSCLRKLLEYQTDTDFGKKNGCMPVKSKLPYNWPLGIDIIKRGLKANANKKLLALFTAFFDELGPNIEPTLLSGRGFVTMDPENIEAVLSSRFQDFHLGPRSSAMMAMLGEGIFTQDGSAWKHSRELLRRQFVRMQYQNLEGFREHVENLVDVLSVSRGIVDLQPFFFRFTLDTTTAMIFGQSVSSLKHEGRDSFLNRFNEASLITATRVRFGDLYWLYTPPGFSAACKAVKAYTDQFVKDALRQGQGDEKGMASDRFTFITDLYHEHRDTRLVRDQLVNVLLAGRDSTASLMTFVFRLLVRHPDTLQKLRKEIEHVLGQETNVLRAHIQHMPYLQCVIKETLRLYPPAPINIRFCKKTSILPRGGGPDGNSPILIRRGMPVAYSVYHMHRRKDLYGSDAGAFRPERWEGSGLADLKWGYLPFNGGPRVCLGKDFALMLASYGIARIIQAFPKIELCLGETWEEPGSERQQLTLVLSSADGCRVNLA